MADLVLMPKAGISVETCMVRAWQKKLGDAVRVGEVLFTFETDKASFECESTAEGILLDIFFEEGDEVAVLTPVCAIGAKGEDLSAVRMKIEKTGAADSAHSFEPVKATRPQGNAPIEHAINASPRAKKLAERLEVDYSEAVPSGGNGRIIERDIQSLVSREKRVEIQEYHEITAAQSEYTDIPPSKIRTIIAETMSASLRNTAQLTHHHSFDARGLLALRADFKRATIADVAGISIGDMILYAVSRVLKAHPDLNSALLNDGSLRRFHSVHLAVAVDTPRGLMVPVISHADEKSLLRISREVKELAGAARAGGINPDLLQGGTFTVSNLGATGIEMFTPILNPPQSGILGVCGVTTRIRETNGALESYPAIGLSLTYDHRAADGAPASRFLQDLCEKLENFSSVLAV
jgi:pyruvate dehydrogenase E2 component (dihydrolipoamide acetyltransferase)